ncbi:MAG TPA: hypothetical protein VLG48_10920 [Candidatus Methylomirabilis sp.]|nr:hypothetical protein [Candidatus Methylomirabilis sp.]
MRSARTARIRFGMLAVMLVLCTLAPIAWAQTGSVPGPPVAPKTESPPTPGIGESHAELTLILVSLVVLVLLAGAKVIDFRRKQQEQAVRLQAQISDALLRERRLAGLPVTATVHIPLWWRSPTRIEMTGQTPTAELWQAAVRVAEQEASRTLAAFHIDDRIAVVPPSMRARAA